MKKAISLIAFNGTIAALYVVLNLLIFPVTYGLSIRLGEILVLACFFRKDAIIGVTLGTFVFNLSSPLPLDLVFGTAATIVACVLVTFSKRLIIASLMPIIANGFIVGFEIYLLSNSHFWLNLAYVAIGELIAMIFALLIFTYLKKHFYLKRMFPHSSNLGYKW